jgi:hypothetical protein
LRIASLVKPNLNPNRYFAAVPPQYEPGLLDAISVRRAQAKPMGKGMNANSRQAGCIEKISKTSDIDI